MLPNSQVTRVLRYLETGASLTSADAWKQWGITRLASVIEDLRKSGFDVTTIVERGIDRDGRPVRFARYKLENKDTICHP